MKMRMLPAHRGFLHHLIISVSSVTRAAPFYGALFQHLGYELGGSSHGGAYEYDDWKRTDQDTPHEISIVTADPNTRMCRIAVARWAPSPSRLLRRGS